ncbi:MAG: sterol desaturase family protein [Chromatiaceae bacterium]|nr:sterol desaturase family protein [Chromatiaceae bacterium]
MMDAIELFTLSMLPVFLVLDRVLRRSAQREIAGWRWRAGTVSVAMFLFVGQIGDLASALIGELRLIDGSGLGTFEGAVIGVLVYELLHYWYHRAVHRSDRLWRFVGHQMHHSAERIDAFGAYFGHPLDLALFTSIAVFVLYALLGLSPSAAGAAAAFLAFNAVFQHADIATPRWLGFLIQRPESHRIHHGRGTHGFNYSDLPLWDALFGTLSNPPPGADSEVGFYDGASARVGEMLVGRDVSKPPVGKATQAVLSTLGG